MHERGLIKDLMLQINQNYEIIHAFLKYGNEEIWLILYVLYRNRLKKLDVNSK